MCFLRVHPTDGIDFHRLSRLNISGGNIRNIALNSAFLAADECVPVNMKHIEHAVQTEYTNYNALSLNLKWNLVIDEDPYRNKQLGVTRIRQIP